MERRVEEQYVPNDVFKFRVVLKPELNAQDVTVYTTPFPQRLTHQEYLGDEKTVQEAYFTKARIESLKQEFIRRILESDEPFRIECVDRDGDYYVTEEMLFKME